MPYRSSSGTAIRTEIIASAKTLGLKSKPGPKPTPLKLRKHSSKSSFLPPIKRAVHSRPRERKLAVLQYWRYGLVPDAAKGENHQRRVTLKEVSKRYKIPISTISDWGRKEESILNTNCSGRGAKPTGNCFYPELEQRLYEKFCQRRTEGGIVRLVWFRLASKLQFKETYPELDPGQFRFSRGWFTRFLTRWGISLRAMTNKAQQIPENSRRLIINWLQFNRRNSQLRLGDYSYDIGRYALSHIVNMDQTPLPFEYLSGKTYALKGDKTIWAKSLRSGWDKRQATLVLTVFADGIGRVKPLIIFKGTDKLQLQETYYGEERKQYDPRVVVWFNPKGYSNTQTTLQWIQELLIPALNPAGSGPRMWTGGPSLLQTLPNDKLQPAILALDAARFHHTSEVLSLLKESDITPSLIPGGCTSLIQVIDVSVNRPLKQIIQDELDTVLEKMGEQALEALDDVTESAIGKRRIIMTWAVGAAWERFCHEKSHIVTKAFRVVGMSLPVNGSRDMEIHIKGLSEIEVGDWRGSRSESETAGNSNLEDLEMEEEEEHDEGWEYDHRD